MWKICQEERQKSKVMRQHNKGLANQEYERNLAGLFFGTGILNL
jgi:hypothetical protein